jgi:hypothetical protein
MAIAQFAATFPDEDHCWAYLIARRWPEGATCPRCNSPKVHALACGHYWQCEQCDKDGYRFSAVAGTIFENTHRPLRDWFRVTHLMLSGRKRVSALHIMRTMGFASYETAYSMWYKIRAALVEPEIKLGGIVEVGEHWIGSNGCYRTPAQAHPRLGRFTRGAAALPYARRATGS